LRGESDGAVRSPEPDDDRNPGASHPSPTAEPPADAPAAAVDLGRLARLVRLEIVEPARALPLLSRDDWRRVDAYAQVYEVERDAREGGGGKGRGGNRGTFVERLKRSASDLFFSTRHSPQLAPVRGTGGLRETSADDDVQVIEVLTPTAWRRYEDDVLVSGGVNSLGIIPLVHIQNTAVPFEYAGASDVDPLVPLQDELNTRLSDRAHRITLQSFKMYLGKGIDGFASLPVSPGRMWATENEQAEIIEFGGDAASPSEDAHLADVREALDKASGVTPIAAGAIKGRIGRLTSAAALRVTMQALLAKTDRKRTTYGAAVARMCELALAWLDRAGLFPTAPAERRVEITWPSPLPENELETLQEAEAKLRLGVPREAVLRELGY
jgi:hypothetical protein